MFRARVDIDFGIGRLPEIRPRKPLFMCGKGRHKVRPLLL